MPQCRSVFHQAFFLAVVVCLCSGYAPVNAKPVRVQPVVPTVSPCSNAFVENQYLTDVNLAAAPEPIDPIEILAFYDVQGRVSSNTNILIEGTGTTKDVAGRITRWSWSISTSSDANGFYRVHVAGRDCASGILRELYYADTIKVTAGEQSYVTDVIKTTNIIVDPTDNTVSGKTSPGLVVEVTVDDLVFNNGCSDPSQRTLTGQTTSTADGSFRIFLDDFSGHAYATLRVRNNAHSSTINKNEAWKFSLYLNGGFESESVGPDIFGTVTFTLSRAGEIIESTSKYQSNYISHMFNTPLQPGDEIRSFSGDRVFYKATVAPLVAMVDLENDRITGQTSPGKDIYIKGNWFDFSLMPNHCSFFHTVCTQAKEDGSFAIDLPVDLRLGDSFDFTIYDDQGNQQYLSLDTGIGIFVDLTQQMLITHIPYTESPNSVTARISDVDGTILWEDQRYPGEGQVDWYLPFSDSLSLPGKVLEVTDGTRSKRMTIPNITVNQMFGSNQISGSAPDGLVIGKFYINNNSCTVSRVSNRQFSFPIPSDIEVSQATFLITHSDEQGGYTSIARNGQYLQLSKDEPGSEIKGSVEQPNVPVVINHHRKGTDPGTDLIISATSNILGFFSSDVGENVVFQQGDVISVKANDILLYSIEIPEMSVSIDIQNKLVRGRGPANRPVDVSIHYKLGTAEEESWNYDSQTDLNGNFSLSIPELMSYDTCQTFLVDTCLQATAEISTVEGLVISKTSTSNVTADIYESDNTPATASLYTGPQQHNFLTLGEQDWIKIEVTPQEAYGLFTIQLTDMGDNVQIAYVFSSADNVGSRPFIPKNKNASSNSLRIDIYTLGAGTYYLGLMAEGSGNVYGKCDSEYTLTILRPPPAPYAPSDLTAGSFTQSGLMLSWRDNSDNEIAFQIDRRNYYSWDEIATTGADVTSLIINNLLCGTQYTFRVYAFTADRNSPLDTTLETATLPCTPTLTASLNQNGQVTLKTSRINSGILNRYERQEKDGTWAFLGTSSYYGGTFTDSTPPCEQTAYYRVRVENSQGYSPWSEPAAVTITTICKPTTMMTLEAQPLSQNAIQLTWTATNGGQSGFILERSLFASNNWVTLATLSNGAVNYLDDELAAGTQYSYRLLAYNAGGNVQSPTITARTLFYNIFLPLVQK